MRDWEIAWTRPGLWALQKLPWQDAARVDAAVMAYAATGEGRVKSLDGDPTRLLLLVASYAVRITLDPFDRHINVWWIYRRR